MLRASYLSRLTGENIALGREFAEALSSALSLPAPAASTQCANDCQLREHCHEERIHRAATTLALAAGGGAFVFRRAGEAVDCRHDGEAVFRDLHDECVAIAPAENRLQRSRRREIA